MQNEIRVIKNFVNCDLYHPDNEKKGAAALRAEGREAADSPLEFPAGEARAGLHPDSGGGARSSVPAHLLMVGDGPERGPAEHLARELGVDEHVTFLGKQNHVERLIPLAHVLLMPSELESFGLAALEAMACGVVPVATRVGGVPELITDGEDGFLEAVGDMAAQAARVMALLTDERCTARWRPRRGARRRSASARTGSFRRTSGTTRGARGQDCGNGTKHRLKACATGYLRERTASPRVPSQRLSPWGPYLPSLSQSSREMPLRSQTTLPSRTVSSHSSLRSPFRRAP